MTWDHIPLSDKPNNYLAVDRGRFHVRCNFMPFIHVRNGEVILKSHHSDENTFCKTHGKITPGLAKSYNLLCEQLAKKPNWAGYTWVEDFKTEALIDLLTNGLYFDLSQSRKPFNYLTTIASHSFKKAVKAEKLFVETRLEYQSYLIR